MQAWWSLALALAAMGRVATPTPAPQLNDRPVIGILAQEMDASLAAAVHGALSPPSGVRLRRALASPAAGPKGGEDAKLTEPLGGLQSQQNYEYLTFEEGEELQKPEVDIVPNAEAEVRAPAAASAPAPTLVARTTSPEAPLSSTPTESSKSYIAASYVKFVETAGARVVPILINQDKEYYERILSSINGVLFPGGAVAIDQTSGFGRAGKLIYDTAVQMNKDGDVFPLWGTCLGFELLMGLAAKGEEIRTRCMAQNSADHVKLDNDYAEGHLLRHMPKALLKALITKPITANFHHFCVTPKNFSDFGVDKVYRPLAYSCDKRGVEYVAVAEARDFPFYAVQFHPEKAPYEWTTAPGHNEIPHSRVAVHLSAFLADVFVSRARRSSHRFANATEEASSLIYNFPALYTGAKTPLEQVYVF